MKLATSLRHRPAANFCSILLGLLTLATVAAGAESLTDEQVRKQMIDESIAAYPGACPCPYSENRAGHNCGGNSAYRKPGGNAPLCYSGDISDDLVEKYRKKHKIPKPVPGR